LRDQLRRRHRPLISSPLEWQMTAAPVPPPVIPVLAERGGTQLKTRVSFCLWIRASRIHFISPGFLSVSGSSAPLAGVQGLRSVSHRRRSIEDSRPAILKWLSSVRMSEVSSIDGIFADHRRRGRANADFKIAKVSSRCGIDPATGLLPEPTGARRSRSTLRLGKGKFAAAAPAFRHRRPSTEVQ
jgi:hypothetical protein